MRCSFLLCRRRGPAYDFGNMMAVNSRKPVIGLVGGVGAGTSAASAATPPMLSNTCNGCHGNHAALPPETAAVSQVCRNCHANNATMFDGSPHKKAFEALTPGRQRSYLYHFGGAKQSATRVDKEMQRYAEEATEARVASGLKGVSLPDGEPVDVMVAGDKESASAWQDGKCC